MKKWAVCMCFATTVLGLAAILATSGFVFVSAQESPKPEKGVVVGQAISLAHYAMKGAEGEGSVEAMAYHAEHGFPVGILEDETGEVYICVYRDNAPASHLETANEVLKPYMGKKIVAQGLVYKAKGVSVMRVSVVSEY